MKDIRYKDLPRFPISDRSLTLEIPEGVAAGGIAILLKGDEPLCEKVEMVDLLGDPTKKPFRLTYRLVYRAADRSLTKPEVDLLFTAAQKRIPSYLFIPPPVVKQINLKVDWSGDYWKPGNHIYEFYKNRKWIKENKPEQIPQEEKQKLSSSSKNFKKFQQKSYRRFVKKKQKYKQLGWVKGKCFVASLPNYDEELGVYIDYSLLRTL